VTVYVKTIKALPGCWHRAEDTAEEASYHESWCHTEWRFEAQRVAQHKIRRLILIWRLCIVAPTKERSATLCWLRP